MSGRGSSSLVIALILLGAGSCRTKPTGCEDSTSERCLWNQGLRQPVVADSEPGQDDLTSDSNAGLNEDGRLDFALTQMVDMMRAGLEWSLVNERASALCTSASEPAPAPASPSPSPDNVAWQCDTALLIDTQGLKLEATAAVLSLSVDSLNEADSAALHELARARFEPWCARDFEELEGTNHLLFYRCALPEGPWLVVARFPRDLEAGDWQVSIAVLDAG